MAYDFNPTRVGEWDQSWALSPNLHFLLSMFLSVMQPDNIFIWEYK